MPNLLAEETSPYLRQHKDNPVDWYPWAEEAHTRARDENKPIFLSIGYSACHWCHVMAHESFEDAQTAQFLNQHFISIKVDREERPDLDNIYMQAVVMLTGQGGWPMSVFLTPDLKPFYGGTYFPPSPHYGRPSFIQVLQSVLDAWQNKRDAIESNAQTITDAIRTQNRHQASAGNGLNLAKITDQLADTYDWQNGGWGSAPKFPQPMVIEFLIQQGLSGNSHASQLVEHNLEQMAKGGMYDLIGGGFHRYSTDINWLVPHFEKMLYDNAQLALTYLHGFALTGNVFFKWVTENTLDFIQHSLTHPDGGFFSSLDADTAEGEGRYYTWSVDALQTHLSSDQFNLLQDMVTLTKQGNFEDGLNILQFKSVLTHHSQIRGVEKTEVLVQLEPIFAKLHSIRAQRLAPGRDEKIITSWNALAIRAFAEAGRLLERPDYLTAARNAANFILNNMQPSPGYLRRSWSQGKADQPGTLSDHAGMVLGLYSLYQIDFSPELFQSMQNIYRVIKEEFSSEDDFYFDAAASVSNLIIRPKNLQDNATPSGNALAAHALWLFANLEYESEDSVQLNNLIRSMTEKISGYPTSFGYWLQVAELWKQPTQQIALVSVDARDSLETFTHIYNQHYRPHSIIAANFDANKPKLILPGLLKDRPPVSGKPTAYICRNFTCLNPITDAELFNKELDTPNNV